jgi:hypothetical protein
MLPEKQKSLQVNSAAAYEPSLRVHDSSTVLRKIQVLQNPLY